MKVNETISDKSIEDIISNNNNVYEMLHCISSSCKKIPSIQLDLTGQVSIQCACSIKDTKKCSINNFLKELNTSFQSISNDFCGFKHHFPNNKKGEFFCIQCNCWLCKECKLEHDKPKPLKFHTFTNRMINEHCNQHQNNQFQYKKYKYYCGICNEHLCKECNKLNTHYTHNKDLISLEHLIESEDVQNKDKTFQEISNQLTIIEKIKENILHFINDIKQKIENKFYSISSYYSLSRRIHNTFLLFPKNYFSIINIINNHDLLNQLYTECKINEIKNLMNNQTFTIEEIEKFISVISINNIKKSLTLNENHNEIFCSKTFSLSSIHHDKQPIKSLFLEPTIKKLTPSINYEKANIHSNITITSIILLEDKRICTSSIEKFIDVFTLTLDSSKCDISKENAHDGMIYSLCQMKNAQLVSSSYVDIKIWTVTQNDLISILNIDIFKGEGFFKVIELPELKFAGCTMNKHIKIWNLKTLNTDSKQPQLCLNGHNSCIKSMLYNINKNYLISASATLDDDIGSIIKWDLSNMNNISKTEIENVHCSSWNSLIEVQENVFAIGGKDSIVVVDFGNRQIRSTLYGPESKKFQEEDDIILIQYGSYVQEKGSFIAQTKGMICLYEYNGEQNNWINVFYTENEIRNDIFGNGMVLFEFGNEYDITENEGNKKKYLISSSIKGLKFWKIETTL